MSYSELIIDTEKPQEEDVMHILPSKLKSTKYLASNIFDLATIKNCPVEKITSGSLAGIFSSLKPLAKIDVIVFQPIAVMLFYDSKQIEANLKLAGFENIKISDITIDDEKTGKKIQTQIIEATKPETKRNTDINIEVLRKKYKNEKREIKEEPPRNRFQVTTTTTTKTSTTEYNSGYKPRNKTYVRQEIKEDPEDQKSFTRKRFGQSTENNDNNRFKNRTYISNTNNNDDGKSRYNRRTKK